MKTKKQNSIEFLIVRDILNGILESDSPFSTAFWQRVANGEVNVNTHPCIDLKTVTNVHDTLEVGDSLGGMLTHDDEDHFLFVEDASKKKTKTASRNPHVYEGVRINVNKSKNGTLYPTFNRPAYNETFTFQDFCIEAANELFLVAGLVEE